MSEMPLVQGAYVCPACKRPVHIPGEVAHVRVRSDGPGEAYHPACWPDIRKPPPASVPTTEEENDA